MTPTTTMQLPETPEEALIADARAALLPLMCWLLVVNPKAMTNPNPTAIVERMKAAARAMYINLSDLAVDLPYMSTYPDNPAPTASPAEIEAARAYVTKEAGAKVRTMIVHSNRRLAALLNRASNARLAGTLAFDRVNEALDATRALAEYQPRPAPDDKRFPE